jgi:hypothetical protein
VADRDDSLEMMPLPEDVQVPPPTPTQPLIVKGFCAFIIGCGRYLEGCLNETQFFRLLGSIENICFFTKKSLFSTSRIRYLTAMILGDGFSART